MKPSEVGYSEELIANVKNHPIIRENFDNLLKDFEFIYVGFLHQEYELNAEQLLQLKGDLLFAFAMGAIAACDLNTNFRIGFKTPEELLFKNKSKIITDDKKIITPTGKIII